MALAPRPPREPAGAGSVPRAGRARARARPRCLSGGAQERARQRGPAHQCRVDGAESGALGRRAPAPRAGAGARSALGGHVPTPLPDGGVRAADDTPRPSPRPITGSRWRPGDHLDLLENKVMSYLGQGDLAGAQAVIRSAPAEVEPTALVADVGNYWDLGWALDEPQQQLLLSASGGSLRQRPGHLGRRGRAAALPRRRPLKDACLRRLGPGRLRRNAQGDTRRSAAARPSRPHARVPGPEGRCRAGGRAGRVAAARLTGRLHGPLYPAPTRADLHLVGSRTRPSTSWNSSSRCRTTSPPAGSGSTPTSRRSGGIRGSEAGGPLMPDLYAQLQAGLADRYTHRARARAAAGMATVFLAQRPQARPPRRPQGAAPGAGRDARRRSGSSARSSSPPGSSIPTS